MKVTSKSRRWHRLFRGGKDKGKSTSVSDTADDMSSNGSVRTDDMAGSRLSEFGSEGSFTIEDSEIKNYVRSFSDSTPSDDSKSQLNSIIDTEERSRIKLMLARLDALQIQQELYGMNHPDVLFSLKHLGRAHTRRGEFQQARLIEEMVRAGHCSQQPGKH
jgi:hypothetical protein